MIWGSALFGVGFTRETEINILRSPDYAKRDIIPTCGQNLFLAYEKGITDIGGEGYSRNTIISIQYLTVKFRIFVAFPPG